MYEKVFWKKGMRLTDTLLCENDSSFVNLVSKVFGLKSELFGLLPSEQPFEISLNFTKDTVEVLSLSCRAVTKSGKLIDIQYDSRYESFFETKVSFPNEVETCDFLLIVSVNTDKWIETIDNKAEPAYTFSLVPSMSPLADNAMPIAHIVEEYGWRMDEISFVPPCIFVKSHDKYRELLYDYIGLLRTIETKLQNLIETTNLYAVRTLWPFVQQLIISVENEQDTMSPMTLLAHIQKYISCFMCVCVLDEQLTLTDKDKLYNFALTPYNFKEVYKNIKQGLEYCQTIEEKIVRFYELVVPLENNDVKVVEQKKPTHAKPKRRGWEGLEI